MKMIDLSVRRQEITDVATEMFQKFINLPKDVRPDDKERSGIQVLVWQPGTRNLVLTSVKEPSEAARFFAIEKAVSIRKSWFGTPKATDWCYNNISKFNVAFFSE